MFRFKTLDAVGGGRSAPRPGLSGQRTFAKILLMSPQRGRNGSFAPHWQGVSVACRVRLNTEQSDSESSRAGRSTEHSHMHFFIRQGSGAVTGVDYRLVIKSNEHPLYLRKNSRKKSGDGIGFGMENLDLVHTFMKTPSKVVESNLLALCSALERSTAQVFSTWQQDRNEMMQVHQKVFDARSVTETPIDAPKNEQNTSEIADITKYQQYFPEAGSSSLDELALHDVQPVYESGHVNGESKRSCPVALKPRPKSALSQKDRFFELKADMSRQDVVDQEVRIMKFRHDNRRQSVPGNILVISGRGRYTHVLEEK